jgi:hypothetical protein
MIYQNQTHSICRPPLPLLLMLQVVDIYNHSVGLVDASVTYCNTGSSVRLCPRKRHSSIGRVSRVHFLAVYGKRRCFLRSIDFLSFAGGIEPSFETQQAKISLCEAAAKNNRADNILYILNAMVEASSSMSRSKNHESEMSSLLSTKCILSMSEELITLARQGRWHVMEAQGSRLIAGERCGFPKSD